MSFFGVGSFLCSSFVWDKVPSRDHHNGNRTGGGKKREVY